MLNTINSGGGAAIARPERNAYGAALHHSARVRRLKVLLPIHPRDFLSLDDVAKNGWLISVRKREVVRAGVLG